MDKQKENEHKPIILPSFDEISKMSVAELTILKMLIEKIEMYLARKIRRKIQN